MSDEDGTSRPGSPEPLETYESESPKKRRRILFVAVPIVLVLAGGAAFVAKQVRDATSSPFKTVAYSVPVAPRLIAASNETVYRIDPSQSTLTYRVKEKIVGQNASTAVGTTNGIAGDIALNTDNPSKSRMGKVVANVEQFHSNNRLRDARIRQDFLESHAFPLAIFDSSTISGLDSLPANGAKASFKIAGKATVHGVTRPVTWKATGSRAGDSLKLQATTSVKLNDFGIEQISIAGLVTASDNAELAMNLVAVDPGKVTVPTQISGPDAKRVGKGPSYSKVVMPILENHCSSCHAPGEVGAAHWELKTANDAAKVSEGLETVTASKYMPPWPASDKGVPLYHPNTLSKAQIDAIAQWSRAGGKLDVPATTPLKAPKVKLGTLPRQDVKLHLPAPYLGTKAETNDYRCFVLDPKITKPKFLTGFTFLTDQIQELHHAQVFLMSAEQAANGEKISGQDGRPGWSCFGSPSLPGKRATAGFAPRRSKGYSGQSNLIAGWVPGQGPALYPKNSGVMLEPGDVLVLQIHYHFEGKILPDQSGLALQLDSGTDPIKKVRVVNPLGPVEIPCSPGATAKLCDRDASLAENVKNYGPMGSITESSLLGICGHTAEDLAARFDGQVAKSDCLGQVPEDGTIFSVLGHMHTLGKSFRLTLDPGTPQAKILLDIPTWNFGWQMNYGLAKPIHVKAGDKILMQCSWDRSVDPNRPQKYIVFADGTEDEMCFGTYGMIPDNQS